MKICFVSDIMFPFYGGLGKNIFDTMCELRDFDNKCYLIAGYEGNMINKYQSTLEKNDIKNLLLKRNFFLNKVNQSLVLTNMYNKNKINKFLDSVNPNIIVISFPSFMAKYIYDYAKYKNIKIIYIDMVLGENIIANNILRFVPYSSLFINHFIHKFIKKSDLVLFFSTKRKNKFIECKKSIYIRHNFNEIFYPIINKKKSKKIRFLIVSRLDNEKNIFIIIEAMNKLRQINNNFITYIIGSGPNINKILHLIEKYNLHKFVKIVGQVKYSKMYKYYNNVDCLIHSAFHEIGPIVIEEALYYKLDVIASNTIQTYDDYQKLDLFFFNPYDVNSLFQVIVSYITKTHKANKDIRSKITFRDYINFLNNNFGDLLNE